MSAGTTHSQSNSDEHWDGTVIVLSPSMDEEDVMRMLIEAEENGSVEFRSVASPDDVHRLADVVRVCMEAERTAASPSMTLVEFEHVPERTQGPADWESSRRRGRGSPPCR